MSRRILVAIAAVTLALTVAACGGDDEALREFCEMEKGQATEANADYVDIATQLELATEKAPGEIKDEMTIVLEATSKYAEATKDLDVSKPADAEAISAAAEELRSPEVENASAKVNEYLTEKC